MGKVKLLSKGLYLGSLCGGAIGGNVLMIFSMFFGIRVIGDWWIYFLFLGFSASIYGFVMVTILFYKLWQSIQGGTVRTTPRKAVGFMFIPFFNIYWMFQLTWGWAIDFNKYVEEKKINTPKVSESIPYQICILWICNAIPYVIILTFIPVAVLLTIFCNKAIDGANAVIRQKGQYLYI